MASEVPSLSTCILCEGRPSFSDNSHLLTHLVSKGHLCQAYKMQVYAKHDDNARDLVDRYNSWYQEANIDELVFGRMSAKEKKRLGERCIPDHIPIAQQPTSASASTISADTQPHEPPVDPRLRENNDALETAANATIDRLYGPEISAFDSLSPEDISEMLKDITESPASMQTPNPTQSPFRLALHTWTTCEPTTFVASGLQTSNSDTPPVLTQKARRTQQSIRSPAYIGHRRLPSNPWSEASNSSDMTEAMSIHELKKEFEEDALASMPHRPSMISTHNPHELLLRPLSRAYGAPDMSLGDHYPELLDYPSQYDGAYSSELPRAFQPKSVDDAKPVEQGEVVADTSNYANRGSKRLRGRAKRQSQETSKLKGTILPGMDYFDSATHDMKRRRNQKKADSVLMKLRRSSEAIEDTEVVFDANFRQQRVQPVGSESPLPSPALPSAGVTSTERSRRNQQALRSRNGRQTKNMQTKEATTPTMQQSGSPVGPAKRLCTSFDRHPSDHTSLVGDSQTPPGAAHHAYLGAAGIDHQATQHVQNSSMSFTTFSAWSSSEQLSSYLDFDPDGLGTRATQYAPHDTLSRSSDVLRGRFQNNDEDREERPGRDQIMPTHTYYGQQRHYTQH